MLCQGNIMTPYTLLPIEEHEFLHPPQNPNLSSPKRCSGEAGRVNKHALYPHPDRNHLA
jgi:hypothetical protein